MILLLLPFDVCKPAPRARGARNYLTILAQGFARTRGAPIFFARRGPGNHAGIQGTRYGPLQSLGDLSDEKVKRDVEAVMKDAIGFFEKYLLA